MNVLIISTNCSLGTGYLSSSLKKYGHQTKFFLINSKLDFKELDFIISDFKPGILLISTFIDKIDLCKDTISYLTKNEIPLFLGGVHATLAPEESINIRGVNGICIGEGECSVVQLVNSLEKDRNINKIPGIWVKKDSKIIKNLPRGLEDIDKLPFPDRSILEGYNYDGGQVSILASRGCPYSCSMCSNHSLRNIYKNKKKYYRVRNVRNVIAEAMYIKKNYAPQVFLFANDEFPLTNSWLEKFSELYKSRIGLPFKCKLHINEIKEGKIRMLKNAGCIQIKLGVESGNVAMLKLIKKGTSLNQIIKACNIIKSQKIRLFCYYMVGFPYETEKSIKDTIKLHKKIRPDVVTVSTFTPFPNTEIYNFCIKEKLINTWKSSNYYSTSTLSLPTITNEELMFYKEYIQLIFTFRPLVFVLYLFFKLNFNSKFLYEILNTLKILQKIKLNILYRFYPKYSLQY